MGEGSLIPANTKKSTLILGMYRWVPDLVILIIGISITVMFLLIFQNVGTLVMLLMCVPMLLSVFLTLPIPNYHNMLGALQSIISFYNGRRKYIWRGWCLRNEYSKDE